MTDIALHQLPEAAALTGAEIVPIDDGTTTVRTTVADLRRGLAPLDAPAFTGTITVDGSTVVTRDAGGVVALSPGRLDMTNISDATAGGVRFSSVGASRFHQISAAAGALVIDRHADGDTVRSLRLDADGRVDFATVPTVAGTEVSLSGHTHAAKELYDAVRETLVAGSGVTLTADTEAAVITVASTGGGASVTESAPIYLAAGASTTLTGSAVLSVAEQIAGTTFSIPYTSEGDYIQEDATNGTDQSGGTFTLHATNTIDSAGKLLLHGEGTDGSAAVVDSGANLVPVTTTGATVSTARAKFGSGSILFDGSACLSIPSASAPSFAANDFVIDFWCFPTTTSGDKMLLTKRLGAGYGEIAVLLSSNVLTVLVSSAGTGWDLVASATAGTLTANAWNHVAIIRSGTGFLTYVNGTRELNTTISGTIATNTQNLRIGGGDAVVSGFVGHIDEFRIAVGTDRGWTGPSITVPTAAESSIATYPTTPHHVVTTDASHIDVRAFSSIDDVSVAATLPTGTAIRYAVSFDGRATWRTWTGGVWASIALHSATILASGLDAATLKTALLTWTPDLGTTIDVAAVLSTTNAAVTPTLDAITVTMDEYTLLTPGVDYAVGWRKSEGAKTITVTRVKSGGANHVISYVH